MHQEAIITKKIGPDYQLLDFGNNEDPLEDAAEADVESKVALSKSGNRSTVDSCQSKFVVVAFGGRG